MGRTRTAAALLVLAMTAGCGSAAPPSGPPAPRLDRPGTAKAATFRTVAARDARRAAQLRATIRRLRGSRSVGGALQLALLTERITPAAHDRMQHDYEAARSALARLTGTRAIELASVVRVVDDLAAQRRLTATRLAPAFLILRRNTDFWLHDALPFAGYRTKFGTDPAVFQYYPGRGLQLQALASWGRANGMAGACLRASPGVRRREPCDARALRHAVDGLLALASVRDGFLAWESYFNWGGGTPPWISGMTQATAIQALARTATALQEPRYAAAARRALGAFEQPPPVGVSVAAPGGRHYLMYSFAPGLRILNGDLQAVTGLSDMATLTGDRTARRLFRHGDAAARQAVRGFDTGAWSLYSDSGRESTLSYHQLLGTFLGNLCDRTRARVYCGAHARFVRYETEPPRIRLARLRGLRARRAVQVRFSLSKISQVDVRVWSKRGTSLSEDLSLPYGRHRLTWVPPQRGTFRLRILARGPSGPAGSVERTIRVVRPRPHHTRHKRPRGQEEARRVDVESPTGGG
jgi:hypothetical protein